MTMILVL